MTVTGENVTAKLLIQPLLTVFDELSSLTHDLALLSKMKIFR